jgi:5-hydroxyisourate hydrolase
MSAITTHVLDTAEGRPAAGISVVLEYMGNDGWAKIASGATNKDGRVADLLPKDHQLLAGTYKLTFNTFEYFSARNTESFYPSVPVIFEIKQIAQHYHVPLLLSPFGYSTYRGS